ncbi:MAG: class I lanthipeptide [Holophagales bacterium]|nr:class I lanthipeptide [Holophagales bacterium]
MKKRKIHKKLRLRKDTLRTLGQDTMGQVVGGTSGHPVCDEHTENEICIATTLARGCVHHPSVGCTDTQGCTYTCNIACTNGCTLGCPTIGGTCTGCGATNGPC